MSTLERRLVELGLQLPPVATPGANYAAVVVHAGVAWVSGQLPRDGDVVIFAGKLGKDVAVDDAKKAARIALLRGMAALRDELGGLGRVRQVLKLNVFVNSTDEFTQHSAVSDGASDLIYQLFGPEQGRHARTSVGVGQLPRGACLELDITVALTD